MKQKNGTIVIDPTSLQEATVILTEKIEAKFNQTYLHKSSILLKNIALKAVLKRKYIQTPNYWLKGLNIIFISLFILTSIFLAKHVIIKLPISFSELIQTLDAGIQLIIFLGLGSLFIVTIDKRIKRQKIMLFFSDLRSLAHIVDFHQLPKDPELLHQKGVTTSNGIKLDSSSLGSYYNFCSEILSIISKIAVYYVESTDDSELTNAVNEIESLTSGLSRKIWQKNMLLHQLAAQQ